MKIKKIPNLIITPKNNSLENKIFKNDFLFKTLDNYSRLFILA